MDQAKKQLLNDIFGIDMEYIDPAVWYVYNVETGKIDDFRDAVHYQVHIDRFIELGARQTQTIAVDKKYLHEIKARSGTITFFEIPAQSQLLPVEAVDDLAAFFDLDIDPMKAFVAVKIEFQ